MDILIYDLSELIYGFVCIWYGDLKNYTHMHVYISKHSGCNVFIAKHTLLDCVFLFFPQHIFFFNWKKIALPS